MIVVLITPSELFPGVPVERGIFTVNGRGISLRDIGESEALRQEFRAEADRIEQLHPKVCTSLVHRRIFSMDSFGNVTLNFIVDDVSKCTVPLHRVINIPLDADTNYLNKRGEHGGISYSGGCGGESDVGLIIRKGPAVKLNQQKTLTIIIFQDNICPPPPTPRERDEMHKKIFEEMSADTQRKKRRNA
jgi:hypothetical protein